MSSPTGTKYPATMKNPDGYYPINSKKGKSRVPGRSGPSFRGDNLPFQPKSQQAHGRPGLDFGSDFPKVAADSRGPAMRP